MEKKIQKMILVLVMMTLEPIAGTYLCCEENSCDRQVTWYETVLTSQI